MMHLILGSAASGKSEYAERCVMELSSANTRYYLATMIAYGESGAYRVNRHRKMREGKGFTTLELATDIAQAVHLIREPIADATLLLEDLSNLLANELYKEEHNPCDIAWQDSVVTKICGDILKVKSVVKNVIVVSNQVFEDGCQYDDATFAFIRCLGLLHQRLAAECDQITEVVVGIQRRVL